MHGRIIKLTLVALILLAALGAAAAPTHAATLDSVGAVAYDAMSPNLNVCLTYPQSVQSDRCLTAPQVPTAQDSSPAWAPDGTALAFTRVTYPSGASVRTVDLDGHETDISSPYVASGTGFAWSPDGASIVFSGYLPDLSWGGLIIVERATGAQTRVPNSPCFWPQWRGGSIFAICQVSLGSVQDGIFRVQADGLSAPELIIPLVSGPNYGGIVYSDPEISPAGNKLALLMFDYTQPPISANLQVYDLVDPTKSAYTIYRYTATAAYPDAVAVEPNLRWSPDGSRLAFSGISHNPDGTDTEGVYLYDVSSNTPPINETANLAGSYKALDWSPSGCHILVSGPDGLALTDSNGKSLVSLGRPTPGMDFRWSPQLSPGEPICVTRSLGSITYVAAGDSVPDGEDLGGCPKGTNCKSQAYPQYLSQQIAAAMQPLFPVTFKNVACSGFTTQDFIGTTKCRGVKYPAVIVNGKSNPTQFGQVLAPAPDLKIVSVTVGADNLLNMLRTMTQPPFKNVGCLTGPDDEQACEQLVLPLLAQVRSDLYKIIGALRTQPGTLVIATGYYHVFEDPGSSVTDPQKGFFYRRLNTYVDRLNSTISDVVYSYNSANVRFVDLVDRFTGHTFSPWKSTQADWLIGDPSCAKIQDIVKWFECAVLPGVHPNQEGQRQIAAQIWSDTGWWIENGFPYYSN